MKKGQGKQRQKGKPKQAIPTAVSQDNLQFLTDQSGKSNASSTPLCNPIISAKHSGFTEHPFLDDRSPSMTTLDKVSALGSESTPSSESEDNASAPKKEERKKKKGKGKHRKKEKRDSTDKLTDQNPKSDKGSFTDISQENLQLPTDQIGKSSTSRKPHISLLEDADICLHYLNGKCAYNENCQNHHQDMPYVWQYRILQQGFKWKSFSKDNCQLLEQSFCNGDTPCCPVILEGQMFNVDFDSKIANAKDINIPVRRLTTTSYVNEPEGQSFVTRWVWFWESDEGWVECGGQKSEDVTKTQRKLEQDFQNNPTGQTSLKVVGIPYQVDFSYMKQKNVKSGTERKLRRRPVFVSPDDVNNAPRLQKLAQQTAKGFKDTQLPANWNPMKENEQIALVTLSEKDRDYKGIKDRFKLNLPTKKIRLVKRIQNPTLWLTFSVKRGKMEREYGPGNTNEMRLFHGTSPEDAEAICEQNFDWRLYGSSIGACFGKGAYFAINPDKADQCVKPDSNGLCYMLAVRVLVGKFTKGDNTIRRPPPIDRANPTKLYDTCSDDPSNPQFFVAFGKEQYYPEFFICYS